jgi:hypothetical protein
MLTLEAPPLVWWRTRRRLQHLDRPLDPQPKIACDLDAGSYPRPPLGSHFIQLSAHRFALIGERDASLRSIGRFGRLRRTRCAMPLRRKPERATLISNPSGNRGMSVQMRCRSGGNARRKVSPSVTTKARGEKIMVRPIQYAGSLLVLSLCLSANPVKAQCSFPFTNLVYGLWKADDGGLYHMRQIGGDVWWVGISSDGGKTFTNVFHGQVKGNTLSGGWLDVPNDTEKRTNAGQVNLRIDNPSQPTKLTKLPSPTGPGASTWNRIFDWCHDGDYSI